MTVLSAPIDPAALAVPAPYVDHFQITAFPGALVRIAFAEALITDNKNYRCAVVIPSASARELALTILNALGHAPPTHS